MTRRLAGHPADDEGITLVELLVASVIGTVVLGLVFGVLISAQQQTASTARTADTVDGLRVAVATMTRQVRLGSGPLSFSSGTTAPSAAFGFATGYAVDGSLSATARCVQYKITNEVLQTRSFTSQPAAGSGWSVVTGVGAGLTSATPFSPPVQGSSTAVRVALAVRQGSSRPVVLDGGATARNTASAPVPCDNFS